MTPEDLISNNHEHLLERPHKYIDQRIIDTLKYSISLGKKVLSNFPNIEVEQIVKIINVVRRQKFNSIFASAIILEDKSSNNYNLPFALYMQASKGTYHDEVQQEFKELLAECSKNDTNLMPDGRVNYDVVDTEALTKKVTELLSMLGDHERLLVLKVICPEKVLVELDLGFILTVNVDEFELLVWLGIACIEAHDIYQNEEVYSDEQTLKEFYTNALYFTNDISKTVLHLTLKYPEQSISEQDLNSIHENIHDNENKNRAANARKGITSRIFLSDAEKEEVKAFALREWPLLPERENSKKMMIYHIIKNLECAKESPTVTIGDLIVNIKDQALL